MRRERLYLQDILNACLRVQKYLSDVSFDDFVNNEEKSDAVIHNLQVIGEAARLTPDSVRQLAPNVPWSRIVGMRHMLVHTYFGLDLEIIFDVAKNEVPALTDEVSIMLELLED